MMQCTICIYCSKQSWKCCKLLVITELCQRQWHVLQMRPRCQLSAELSCYSEHLELTPAELWQSLHQCCHRCDESVHKTMHLWSILVTIITIGTSHKTQLLREPTHCGSVIVQVVAVVRSGAWAAASVKKAERARLSTSCATGYPHRVKRLKLQGWLMLRSKMFYSFNVLSSVLSRWCHTNATLLTICSISWSESFLLQPPYDHYWSLTEKAT